MIHILSPIVLLAGTLAACGIALPVYKHLGPVAGTAALIAGLFASGNLIAMFQAWMAS